MAPRAQLLEHAKERVRQAFSAFEGQQDTGVVLEKDLGAIVRALGYNVSEAQVAQLMQRLPPPGDDAAPPGYLSLRRCEGVLAAFIVDEEKGSLQRDGFFTLLRAFKALDPAGTGVVDAARLKAALMSDTCPEPLSEKEAAALAAFAADPRTGAIDCEALAYTLANDGRDI